MFKIQLNTLNKKLRKMKSVTLQLPKMKQPKEFTMYPISKDDNSVIVQNQHRIAKINLDTGKGVISKSVNGAYFYHLTSLAGAIEIELDQVQLNELKLTAISNGEQIDLHGIVKADNSGIANIKF